MIFVLNQNLIYYKHFFIIIRVSLQLICFAINLYAASFFKAFNTFGYRFSFIVLLSIDLFCY